MSSGNTDNDDTNESLVARDIVVDAINTVISNISLNTAVDDNTADTHSPVTEVLDVLPTVLESPPPFPPLEWGDNLVAPAKDEPMVVSSSPVLDEFIPSQILEALGTEVINTEYVQQESMLDKVPDAVQDAVQESVQYDQVLDQVHDAVQEAVQDAVQEAVQVVETTTSQLSIQEYVSLDIHKSESEVSSTNTIHTPPPSKKSWGACIYDWVKSLFSSKIV